MVSSLVLRRKTRKTRMTMMKMMMTRMTSPDPKRRVTKMMNKRFP
jgi:hypothetical protein